VRRFPRSGRLYLHVRIGDRGDPDGSPEFLLQASLLPNYSSSLPLSTSKLSQSNLIDVQHDVEGTASFLEGS